MFLPPADVLGGTAESISILVGVITLLSIGSGFAIRSIKNFIKGEVGAVKREVTPNGGNTEQAGDQLVQIRNSLTAMRTEQSVQHEETNRRFSEVSGSLAKLNNKFQQHIGEHMAIEKEYV